MIGADANPYVALAATLLGGPLAGMAAKFIALAETKGALPHLRLTAAFSDGQTLYALRYATDDRAPTLYHRWSDKRQGRAVVSEPLETDESDWNEVPAGSFCIFTGASVEMRPFLPKRQALAAE